MNEKYNDWINNSPRWRDELGRKLEKCSSSDVYAQYADVAFAFPSNIPSPYSFDYPLVDDRRLSEWADSKGWKVQLVPTVKSEESEHRPVRFTKK